MTTSGTINKLVAKTQASRAGCYEGQRFSRWEHLRQPGRLEIKTVPPGMNERVLEGPWLS